MSGGTSKLGLAVCCFLLGGAAVNVLCHWSESRAPYPAAVFADADPDAPGWPELIARYDLREISRGTVVTDRGTPIPVHVAHRPSAGRDSSPNAVVDRLRRSADLVRLSSPGGECDCHGWVFLGGRAWLLGDAVETILDDNGYRLVTSPRPGDLVIYRAGGQVSHSGVVAGLTADGEPLVESVWGDQGRFAHRAEVSGYGPHQFYRSDRPGHRLHGWEAVSPGR
jgi:hypothetical protein